MVEPRRTRIRRRAQNACEYCRLPQSASILPHQIDYIITQQHIGMDAETNLCLCCLRCHLKKGPNVASTDPEVEGEYRIVALLHPRKQRWPEHFHLRGVSADLLHGFGRVILQNNRHYRWIISLTAVFGTAPCLRNSPALHT